jgi:F-type H+-transporting ATPase subunit a
MPSNKTFETVEHIFSGITVLFLSLILGMYLQFKLKDKSFLIPNNKISIVNLVDLLYALLISFMKDIIGDKYFKHISFVGSLGLFIALSNIIGLVPGLSSPTSNLNTTVACGLSVFLYFNYQGLATHGFGHVSHIANPLGYSWGWFLAPFFFPIELMGLLIRPFSLGIRLAGNMVGDHNVLMAFSGLMPFLLPIPFLFFGLMVSLIQVFVFLLLTCVYISLHTSESH